MHPTFHANILVPLDLKQDLIQKNFVASFKKFKKFRLIASYMLFFRTAAPHPRARRAYAVLSGKSTPSIAMTNSKISPPFVQPKNNARYRARGETKKRWCVLLSETGSGLKN